MRKVRFNPIGPKIPGELTDRRNEDSLRCLISASCPRKRVVKGAGNPSSWTTQRRFCCRAEVYSLTGNEMLPHRLDQLIRRGREPPRITVDLNLHVSHPVNDKGWDVVQVNLKLVSHIERFIVCDDAEGYVGLLRKFVPRLFISAESDICDRLQGFNYV